MPIARALDGPRAISYLGPMATRLLLTMLALMAGFAAQFSPAQARGSAAVSTEIGALATDRTRQQRAVLAISPAEWRRHDKRLVDNPAPLVRPTGLPGAPVLPGVDRSRE